ncbi:MAG TPA: SAM-dependent methyltransferase [Candidatus Acidoferrales bacterium]|nr:SAM-dependent methyltransferase [Candidatus Acidoferrales bacterium]
MQSAAAAAQTPLARELARRIASNGPITFAEYMETCLYDPAHGYYSRPERTRFADYYTSVDVHPIFGRLMARQLDEMWRLLDRPASFEVVEAGAGAGRLAGHILDFAAARLPDFYSALKYFAVERSPARRAAHTATIGGHLATGRAESRAELPTQISAGCVLSNELIDAMPVHRVECREGQLREVFVSYEGGRFMDAPGSLSTQRIEEYFKRQGTALAEGQEAEAGLAACNWIAESGGKLQRGFVLTVDYGYEARQLYGHQRTKGTLLAYRDHRVNDDFYAAPGEQDLTSHANFTALELWGRDGELELVGIVPQCKFLLALGQKNEFADLYDTGQSEPDRLRAQLGLSSLIHPEGMGETFRVMVQKKGIGAARLTGLAPL